MNGSEPNTTMNKIASRMPLQAFEQVDNSQRILVPGQLLDADGSAGASRHACAQGVIGRQPGHRLRQAVAAGRVEQDGVVAVGEDFLDVRLGRADDRFAEGKIFEQLER